MAERRSPSGRSLAPSSLGTSIEHRIFRAGRASPILRRPAASRLPHVSHRKCAGDDGRQRRPRNYLLGRVPEIPITGARRLCGAVALAAVSVVFERHRRPCRPCRSAPAGANRHGAVHVLLAQLVAAHFHEFAADVARGRALTHPWLRRRVLGSAEPGADPRHRRPGKASERRPPHGDRALSRSVGGTGGPPGVSSGIWPPLWIDAVRTSLSAPVAF